MLLKFYKEYKTDLKNGIKDYSSRKKVIKSPS